MSRPSIHPVVWQPPPHEHFSSSALPQVRTFHVHGHGPEDVVVDSQGSVYTGVDDGRIIRVDSDASTRVVAHTGGRPLGLEWLPDGRLLVCDADRGLLAVDHTTGSVETLVTVVDGRPLRVCNNAAVARDGTIWFTDSTARFDLDYWKADLLEHSGTGRLLRRDPDGTTTTVLAGLQFANGVALSADESRLYVAQTGSYSLTRIDLDKPDAPAVVVESALPGFPDNLSTGSDGLIWMAIASPRNPLVDRLAKMPGVFRKVAWALPDKLQPQPESVIGVMAFDPSTDAVRHYYTGETADFGTSTGVRESGGAVWLGSLVGEYIAAFDLP